MSFLDEIAPLKDAALQALEDADDLAATDSAAFGELVNTAKSALEAKG